MHRMTMIALAAVTTVLAGCRLIDSFIKPKMEAPADEVSFAELNWSMGGVNGANAALSNTRIRDLKINGKKGMSYSWMQGSLAEWGLADTQADARACIFYYKDGKWDGGFWEWISTSRTTRSFDNITGKYKGWNWGNIPSDCDAAFLILSKDGTKRTNVIKGRWTR